MLIRGTKSYEVLHITEIDSTNNYIKQHWKELPDFSIIWADFQTNGRGQFDRSWVSSKNENLLCSILLKVSNNHNIELLNQMVIDTIIQLLDQYGIKASFKMPNDIYVTQKKIAGILIERQFEQYNVMNTIIGIGLNVNQVLFEGLNATSMHNETKKKYDIEEVLISLVSIFDSYIS